MTKIMILPVFSSVILAAHFLRVQNEWHALLALLMPFVLLLKRTWVLRIFQLYLIGGGIIWISSLIYLRGLRISEGEPWVRLVIILGIVALMSFLSALLFENKKVRRIYNYQNENIPYRANLIAFLLTASLLTIVHFQVEHPMLLLERLLPGSFGIEIFVLSFYASWITEKMRNVKETPEIRSRIWTFFSIVFFSQFVLGISGLEKFLMTGKLHLPIPAMIIAGPLFRGQGFFMLILFSATVVLAGSAWCSHLCYIGSWDNLVSWNKKRTKSLPARWKSVRLGIFLLIALTVLLLRLFRVSSLTATSLAIAYGLGGIGVMVFISRKNGVMTHCTMYCPIGLAADVLGKISPFRIRFSADCDDCGACRYSCRYQALENSDIMRRKPGISCTLCGDCLRACPKRALRYKLFGLLPQTARTVFIVFIVSLHAVFLGVARI